MNLLSKTAFFSLVCFLGSTAVTLAMEDPTKTNKAPSKLKIQWPPVTRSKETTTPPPELDLVDRVGSKLAREWAKPSSEQLDYLFYNYLPEYDFLKRWQNTNRDDKYETSNIFKEFKDLVNPSRNIRIVLKDGDSRLEENALMLELTSRAVKDLAVSEILGGGTRWNTILKSAVNYPYPNLTKLFLEGDSAKYSFMQAVKKQKLQLISLTLWKTDIDGIINGLSNNSSLESFTFKNINENVDKFFEKPCPFFSSLTHLDLMDSKWSQEGVDNFTRLLNEGKFKALQKVNLPQSKENSEVNTTFLVEALLNVRTKQKEASKPVLEVGNRNFF